MKVGMLMPKPTPEDFELASTIQPSGLFAAEIAHANTIRAALKEEDQ
jgi:hypothetical protein